MYVWFSCKAIKLSTNTKLEYSPMKMSGVLVEKVPKTYFVGVAWTLFTPLRDTISVSNNRIIFSGITIFK